MPSTIGSRAALALAFALLLIAAAAPPAEAWCGKRCCTIDCSASPPRERPEREERPPSQPEAPQHREPDRSAEYRWQLAEAKRAEAYVGLNRYDEALAIYYGLAARSLYPELDEYERQRLPELYRDYLKWLLSKNQLQHAESVARRALAWWAGDFTARYYLAHALRSQGRHQEALTEFARCAGESNHWLFHFWHAEAFVSLRRYAEAEAPFQRAIALSPADTDTRAEYGATLLLQKKNPGRRFRCFSRRCASTRDPRACTGDWDSAMSRSRGSFRRSRPFARPRRSIPRPTGPGRA